MRLRNYALAQWREPEGALSELRDASTGDVVAECSSEGLDFRAMAEFARKGPGPQLRAMTFHQRAAMLKALATYLNERKEKLYPLSAATGATRTDSWFDIDGGIQTLFVFASKGRRELPDERVYPEGNVEQISRGGTFLGQHILTPLQGVAVHINAFNFPCWGMLEKLAPTLLAGMPAIVKPATATAFLAEAMVRQIVESGILPEGAVQLVCGSLGDLFDHLICQDAVSFTGSAATAHKISRHGNLIAQSVRFIAETDSLNCSILAPDAAPGEPEFGLFVREVAREMTVKAGQKCTAIRRALVPAARASEVVDALRAELAKIVVGDPRAEGVNMGPLATLAQRDDVRAAVRALASGGETVFGDPEKFAVKDADPGKGAFLPPILLLCRDAPANAPVHRLEPFGPVSSIVLYKDLDDAIALANRGQGSLVGSLFTNDPQIARAVALGAGAFHGRLLIVDRGCAKESTGHGSPLPHLVHGGPGRAGGGEEMGGVRGVAHYMQRTAIQASPDVIAAIANRWIKGAKEIDAGVHPFRRHFEDLRIGETIRTKERTITLEDIEHFAAFTGDKFYAHMDEDAAKANPFFEGRVAHGYLVLAFAAGLFVDPAPGPVLANYGLDALNFLRPVYPGDALKVRLTVKQKTPRSKEYGEVRWAVEVFNQKNETCATYDLLTMNAYKAPRP